MIKIELGKFGKVEIGIEDGKSFVNMNEQAAELIYNELHKQRQKTIEAIKYFLGKSKEKQPMKKEIILNEFEKSYIISKIEEDINHTNFRKKAIDMMTENGTKKNMHHIQELIKLDNEINRLNALREKML